MARSSQDQTVTMLEQMLVHGIKPYPHQLHEYGIDKRYLQTVLDKLKYHISSLSSYRPIKDALRIHKNDEKSSEYTEASWMDIHAIRIANGSESFSGSRFLRPVVTLYGNKDYQWTSKTRHLEVFVTSNGEWILCDESKLQDEDFSPAILRSIDELQEYFDNLTSDLEWPYPHADTVLVCIANWLLNTCRDELQRLRNAVGDFEYSIAECDQVRERFGYNTRSM